jgi:hypothetical protein
VVPPFTTAVAGAKQGCLEYTPVWIDTRRPNHDNVHAMTAMKCFRRKWIAVNPLYTVVFGMILVMVVHSHNQFGFIQNFGKELQDRTLSCFVIDFVMLISLMYCERLIL